MKKKSLRVLQIMGTLDMGGIENFIMNVYRNLDKELIQFDFVINESSKNYFEDEVLKLGGKIYKIPSIRKSGHFKYFRELRKIFKKEEYKIVHSHYNTLSGLILKEAKKCKVKNRIAHNHTAPLKNMEYYKGISGLYKRYSKSLISKNATKKIACSKLAGDWLYNKSQFIVLNNGIKVSDYTYSLEKRKSIRNELLVEDNEILLGHIGRMDKNKNQEFIIEIFLKLSEINSKYKLCLVGDGAERKKLEKKVKKMKLENKVVFLGIRNDVKRLLQGFDLLLFPSLYEGLPVTLIEAQASGLKCFISDSITNEVDMGCELINYISLDKTSIEWASIINNNKEYIRKNTSEFIIKNEYDIEMIVKKMEKMYLVMDI